MPCKLVRLTAESWTLARCTRHCTAKQGEEEHNNGSSYKQRLCADAHLPAAMPLSSRYRVLAYECTRPERLPLAVVCLAERSDVSARLRK